MMGTKLRTFAPQINVSLEELVPQDHFYRYLAQYKRSCHQGQDSNIAGEKQMHVNLIYACDTLQRKPFGRNLYA